MINRDLICREYETEGKEYNFRSEEIFKQKIEDDAFLEFVQYNNKFYGTEYSEIEKINAQGKICLIEIELEGSQNVNKKKPEWNYIYIFPPNVDSLVKR